MARRPDIGRAVDRLGKYAAREPWLAHRRAHFERMLGRVPERYALAPSDIYAEIAELGHAGTMLGFLDESFLAAEFGADNANVIDEYLKRRGWQETPRAREYLQGLRSTAASLYEVHAVVPGEWIELRDLCRAGPPQRIGEEMGSRSLQRWDHLVARVVAARGEAMLTGGVLSLARESAEALEGILTRARDKGRRTTEAHARKLGVDLELVSDGDDTMLRVADPVFLQIWLKGLLDLRRRAPPALSNTDGEALLLSRTRLPVLSADEAEVIRRMDALGDWDREQENLPAWLWRSGTGDELQMIHANARLGGGALVIETNSRERMERALAALRGALGALIGEALTSHEDPMTLLRHGAPRGAPDEATGPALEGPEVDAVIHQFKDAHYRRVLDEPVPALGDRTPRECVRTKAGRARLVRWLKDLENGELRQAAAGGQTPYDVRWMWRELGVSPD
jgi:hypothetical protein